MNNPQFSFSQNQNININQLLQESKNLKKNCNHFKKRKNYINPQYQN